MSGSRNTMPSSRRTRLSHVISSSSFSHAPPAATWTRKAFGGFELCSDGDGASLAERDTAAATGAGGPGGMLSRRPAPVPAPALPPGSERRWRAGAGAGDAELCFGTGLAPGGLTAVKPRGPRPLSGADCASMTGTTGGPRWAPAPASRVMAPLQACRFHSQLPQHRRLLVPTMTHCEKTPEWLAHPLHGCSWTSPETRNKQPNHKAPL